ncbi:hypothetical protein [Rhodococcus opacus]|uniref:hypothetical protein n=1 Tax=Rhodococcus opacus TaxID=37919 RepID=UPI00105736DE|nr:hypothetical protein [Rhodococcus opacus]
MGRPPVWAAGLTGRAVMRSLPALATTRQLVHDFAELMIERRGSDLGAWMRASTPISAIGRKRSLLDEFKPHLHERFNAGCTDAARLTLEIVGLGYCGSDKTVRRYLQELLCKRVIHTV